LRFRDGLDADRRLAPGAVIGGAHRKDDDLHTGGLVRSLTIATSTFGALLVSHT
jgi:hypothetical protein